MYEETKFEFNWKGFLLKLAFVIVVIILVIKLLPLNTNKKNNTANGDSELFSSNMSALKDAGNSFFSYNNLPTSVGESITISLDDLVSVGAIKELKDEDDNACDKDASYVRATKNNNDYDLEIYLVCGSESEKSHIYLGCYGFCDEKTTTNTTTTTAPETTTTRPPSGNTNSNNNNSNNSSSTKNTTAATTKKTTTTLPISYTVIFNSNGGSSVSSKYVLAGNKVAEPANPTRAGYKFLGWYYNGSKYNFSSSVTSNRILIAKWEANSSTPVVSTKTTTKTPTTTTVKTTTTVMPYTVTFNSNGGTSVASKTVAAGGYVTKPTNPTKANATFLGWYYNGIEFNFGTTRIYSNITLVAKYLETKTYVKDIYSSGWGPQVSTFKVTHTLTIPNALKDNDYSNVRIKSVSFVRSLSSATDIYYYDKYHTVDFEYNMNGYEFTSGIAANLAYISYASMSYSGRVITWSGNVGSQCVTPFNYIGITNACMYGILYRATWEYEIIN